MRQRVAVGCGLLFVAAFVCSGIARPFGNGDEVIYAENVRRMVQTGDLTTLHWYGVEVLQRPSLPFVLASVGARFIRGEAGMRLSSALFSLSLLALLYAEVMQRFARRDAALLAVVACAGIPTYHAYGALLFSDPPFVLGTTLAIVSGLRALSRPAWVIGVGIGLGWAMACKSMAVAIVAVALAPLLFYVCRRQAGPRPTPRQLAVAAGFACLLGLPFYAIGLWLHGQRFIEQHIVYSLMKRASGSLGSASMGGPLTYLHWLWTADGALCCLWMSAAVVIAGVLGRRRRSPELLALALLPCGMLALYSAVGSRLPHYLLPMYPVVALTLAHAYVELTGPDKLGGVRGSYAPLAAVAVLLHGQWNATAEQHLKYDPAAVILGRSAAALAAPGDTVFAHEWYAPAFGYYAGRPFRLTTNYRKRYAALQSVDFFRAAGVPAAVPPAPLPVGRRFLVAGPAPALRSANWMVTEQVLAAAGDIYLVRARAVDPRTGDGSAPVREPGSTPAGDGREISNRSPGL